MLFNSPPFLLFFPLVTAVTYLLPRQHRGGWLLLSSYVFLGFWRVEYLGLLLLSTIVDYFAGLRVASARTPVARAAALGASLGVNLGILFLFKYYNFLNRSLDGLMHAVGSSSPFHPLDVILPVGISFYTFQTLSYTIDVYRGTTKPERSFGVFALFVSFFPQLVAGPIERSNALLPQLGLLGTADSARITSGLRLMLWGFFKKVVVADRLAPYVDRVYGAAGSHEGLVVVLATYFFAFQIYCDFSGYSDIAIGAARVLGVNLSQNFRSPYLAASIREFWQRWHISLSSWFRDYVYVPLGGSRHGFLRTLANVLVVFLVSGLWHGANWTFVAWGALHGLYLVISLAIDRARVLWASGGSSAGQGARVSAASTGIRVGITFHLVLVSWVFFRAPSLSDAATLLQSAWHVELAQVQVFAFFGLRELVTAIVGIGIVCVGDLATRTRTLDAAIEPIPAPIRWVGYYLLLLAIAVWGEFGATEFIYFQF